MANVRRHLANGKRPPNFEDVCTALERARNRKFRALVVGWRLDAARESSEELNSCMRQLEKTLTRILRRANKVFAAPKSQPIEDWDPEGDDIRFLGPFYQKVLALYKSGAFLPPRNDRRLRRPKRGHQPEPWLMEVDQELRRAGVRSAEDRKALKQAACLISYR